MNLPDNELGLNTLDDLIHWTNTYFHFKQALEVVGLAPELSDPYFSAFEPFVQRLTQELANQERLEARLPKEMGESIAAENLICPLFVRSFSRAIKSLIGSNELSAFSMCSEINHCVDRRQDHEKRQAKRFVVHGLVGRESDDELNWL